jgi:hypothetical protein
MHGEHQYCPDQDEKYIIADLRFRHVPSPRMNGRVNPPHVLKASASRAGIPIFMPSGFAGVESVKSQTCVYKTSKLETLLVHMAKIYAKKSPVSRAQLRMLLGRTRRDQL